MAQEIEAKFYVQRLDELQSRLQAMGAGLVEPRVKESNIRFDTPTHDLREGGRVLRLRQDTRARLTFKDAGVKQSGALSRQEVEFTVGDFEAARELLEALGYQVALIYEKFRTTYELDDAEIMLDEMPYGNFVEIEGEAGKLQPIAEKLGLKWERAIQESYAGLFDKLRRGRRLQFRDLTFENFRGVKISPQSLGVIPADV